MSSSLVYRRAPSPIAQYARQELQKEEALHTTEPPHQVTLHGIQGQALNN